MTALALHRRSLSLPGESNLRFGHGLRRSIMGPLERNRLKAVLAQAARAGIQGSIPELLRDPRLVQCLSRQFKVPAPSHEACLHYYRDHSEKYRAPDRYAGRQILLRAESGDAAMRGEAWARAERLIAILFFDPHMFADLVATYDSVSDESGSGRLGPVMRGELPVELDSALFGLKPGQIFPAPVATELGIHVVMLDRILPGTIEPFSVAHGRIAAQLRDEMRTAAARRHLARLAERYKASVD